MLIRLRSETGIFDKFIFLNDPKSVYLKFNDKLYLAWEDEVFYSFLFRLISSEKLAAMSSSNGKLIRGNVDISDLLFGFPPLPSSDFYLSQFKLAKVGVEFDRVAGSGHLEIKYQHKDNLHWWLVQNIHVHPDALSSRRIVGDYLRIFVSLHKKFLKIMEINLPCLAAVTLGNFRLFGFSIAIKSEPYYAADLLGMEDLLAETAYHSAIVAKRSGFDELTAELSSTYLPFDDEGYPLPSFCEQLRFFELELRRVDYAFLKLTDFSSLFAASKWGYSIGDSRYDGDPIGVRFEVAVVVKDAIFAYADLQGLNLGEACFVNTDFTGADMRGVSLDVMNMDEPSLVTLTKAKVTEELIGSASARLAELRKLRAESELAHPGQLCHHFEMEPVVLSCDVSSLVGSSSSHRKRAVAEAYANLLVGFTLFGGLSRKARTEGIFPSAVEAEDEDEDVVLALALKGGC